MEFIRAEEFLKQPKQVQKVFLDWWKPSFGDLINTEIGKGFVKRIILNKIQDMHSNTWNKFNVVPLLTEGQLRKFIEDNGYGVELRYYDDKSFSYSIYEFNEGYDAKNEDDETDLLQAYWKVALEIAKEGKQ